MCNIITTGEGNNLGLFSFTVDYRAGDISCDAYVCATSGNQKISGTTSLIPEPVSTTLFVISGTFIAGRCFWKKRRSA